MKTSSVWHLRSSSRKRRSSLLCRLSRAPSTSCRRGRPRKSCSTFPRVRRMCTLASRTRQSTHFPCWIKSLVKLASHCMIHDWAGTFTYLCLLLLLLLEALEPAARYPRVHPHSAYSGQRYKNVFPFFGDISFFFRLTSRKSRASPVPSFMDRVKFAKPTSSLLEF